MELADELVGITDAKNRLPRVVERLQRGEANRVVILRKNSPVAVILSVKLYDELRALETEREFLEDAALIHAANSADDGTRWTLDEVEEELGIEEG